MRDKHLIVSRAYKCTQLYNVLRFNHGWKVNRIAAVVMAIQKQLIPIQRDGTL